MPLLKIIYNSSAKLFENKDKKRTIHIRTALFFVMFNI